MTWLHFLRRRTLNSSSFLVNSGRPKWHSSRETLKEFLLLCAKKLSALRYWYLSMLLSCKLLDSWKNVLPLTDEMFYLILQKEKAKNFKRQIVKYLECLLQSQQQVSLFLSDMKMWYLHYQIFFFSNLSACIYKKFWPWERLFQLWQCLFWLCHVTELCLIYS